MMDHRRKWDRQKYEEIARAAMSFNNSSNSGSEDYPAPLEYLKPRNHKINFHSFASRKVIIGTSNAKSYSSGGFHCSVCDIIVKSDHSYLDHINGKRHQRLMGMSMKVKPSTLRVVRRKLRNKKNDSEQPQCVGQLKETLREVEEENRRMADLEEFSKNKKRRHGEEERELPSELQEVMGFSNFVMNKKK